MKIRLVLLLSVVSFLLPSLNTGVLFAAMPTQFPNTTEPSIFRPNGIVRGSEPLGAGPRFMWFKSQVPLLGFSPLATADDSCLTFHVILGLLPENGEAVDPAMLDATMQLMYRRIVAFDIDAFDISAHGDSQVMIQFQGVSNPETIVEVLRQPALLEFIDPEGAYLPPGTKVSTTLEGPGQDAITGGSTYTTIVSSSNLIGARRATGLSGQPRIEVTMSSEASKRINTYTSTHIGSYMSTVIDKTVISSPVITGTSSHVLYIDGFPPGDIDDLVIQLNAGPLPTSVEVVQSKLADAPCISKVD